MKLYLSERFVRVDVRYFQTRDARDILCFQGDREHRADPEETQRVVCSRSDFTAPTGQAGQLLVVKLCAGEAIAKVSGHAGPPAAVTALLCESRYHSRRLCLCLLLAKLLKKNKNITETYAKTLTKEIRKL